MPLAVRKHNLKGGSCYWLDGGHCKQKTKLAPALFSLFLTHEMLSCHTHWTSKYNLLSVKLFNVYQQWIFLFFTFSFIIYLVASTWKERAFSLRKRKRTKECVACSILAAGPGLLSAAHTSISLFAWAFGIVNYIWIFFLDDKHVVLLSTKACFQGRALPSGLCVNAVKLTLHTEHFRNPSACISCIRLPLPFLPQSLM